LLFFISVIISIAAGELQLDHGSRPSGRVVVAGEDGCDRLPVVLRLSTPVPVERDEDGHVVGVPDPRLAVRRRRVPRVDEADLLYFFDFLIF
jgi:hypothetical protein